MRWLAPEPKPKFTGTIRRLWFAWYPVKTRAISDSENYWPKQFVWLENVWVEELYHEDNLLTVENYPREVFKNGQNKK